MMMEILIRTSQWKWTTHSFRCPFKDLNGHPGITSGTVVLYEWIDDGYQIIDQYDVSFRQVN